MRLETFFFHFCKRIQYFHGEKKVGKKIVAARPASILATHCTGYRYSALYSRARQIGCPDARDNQKMVLGNQQFEAGCPVGNQGYVNNFP